MRTPNALVAGVAILFLVACGDATLTGTWSGTVTIPGGRAGTPMLLTLIEDDGAVRGEAFMVFMTLEVAGTREGAEASMTLTGELLEAPTPLEGTLDEDVFTGRWWGPGATEPATFRLERLEISERGRDDAPRAVWKPAPARDSCRGRARRRSDVASLRRSGSGG